MKIHQSSTLNIGDRFAAKMASTRGHKRFLLPLLLTVFFSSSSHSLDSFDDNVPLLGFLKFHKVAGATVATIFRNACPDHLPRYYWNYASCPATPHGHGSLTSYRKKGVHGMYQCLYQNSTHPILLASIVRNPVDRILSALHFFYGGRYKRWAKTEQDIALSVSLAEKGRSGITKELVDRLPRESGNHWRQPLNTYSHVLAKGLDESSTDAAMENLERDFDIIGLTEDVSSFAVLLAIKTGWPLDAVCLYSVHVNSNRTSSSSLPSDILEHIQHAVRYDTVVYEHAKKLHQKQIAQAGSKYVEYMKVFTSQKFIDACEAKQKVRAAERKARGTMMPHGC
jgi:hypothetical protein